MTSDSVILSYLISDVMDITLVVIAFDYNLQHLTILFFITSFPIIWYHIKNQFLFISGADDLKEMMDIKSHARTIDEQNVPKSELIKARFKQIFCSWMCCPCFLSVQKYLDLFISDAFMEVSLFGVYRTGWKYTQIKCSELAQNDQFPGIKC